MKLLLPCLLLASLLATTSASVAYNAIHYPNLTPGYSQYIGYQVPVGCPVVYCNSPYNNQYYCCNSALSTQSSLYNPSHYPGILPQFTNQIFGYPPPHCANTFCRSRFTNQYYCCSRRQQQLGIGSGGILVNDPYYNPHTFGKK